MESVEGSDFGPQGTKRNHESNGSVQLRFRDRVDKMPLNEVFKGWTPVITSGNREWGRFETTVLVDSGDCVNGFLQK